MRRAEQRRGSVTDMILAMGWPVANFIIFVGVLYYFFNQPFKDYLASRSTAIRKDLVEAAELKAAATAQLATIEQQAAGAAGRARGLAHGEAPAKSRRKSSASPRPQPPTAIACSNRPAARSICKSGSRSEKSSSMRQICRCSWPPSASRKKSRPPIRIGWSIGISIR